MPTPRKTKTQPKKHLEDFVTTASCDAMPSVSDMYASIGGDPVELEDKLGTSDDVTSAIGVGAAIGYYFALDLIERMLTQDRGAKCN